MNSINNTYDTMYHFLSSWNTTLQWRESLTLRFQKTLKTAENSSKKLVCFNSQISSCCNKKNQNQYLIKNGILFLIADDRVRFHNKKKKLRQKNLHKNIFWFTWTCWTRNKKNCKLSRLEKQEVHTYVTSTLFFPPVLLR